MSRNEYDAVVVGSGPNGLAAAITLQQEGRRVLLLEAKGSVGGGTRSAELTLPGFTHDVCSAVQPMAAASPFFRSLPLHRYGLEFLQPTIPLAHPLDDGASALLYRDLQQTATELRGDADSYINLFAPLVESWPYIIGDLLGPLGIPTHPLRFAQFGLRAVRSAKHLAGRFHTPEARALFAGLAAHSFRSLDRSLTSAIGLVLTIAGHREGWPIVRGGSQNLANALLAHFLYLGGHFEADHPVHSLRDLPPSAAVLFDLTPRQLLSIAGDALSPLYRKQLTRYRYGMGVFKVDWALSGPVPFTNSSCRLAGTVHIGGTFEEVQQAEEEVEQGRNPARPFVLFAQQSRFDRSRAPGEAEVAWACCHVPHGSEEDRTQAIESQMERFAPGFRDLILARHTMNTTAFETYNPNYIGGDINGGAITPTQLFTRPALRIPVYRTSNPRYFLCSSSTPPGGGVHGMCGFHAARAALQSMH